MIDKQKPAPLAGSGSGLSSGNFFDELSAAEGHNRILVSGCPRFGVAVDEGDVSRILHVIHATLEKPLIFVLAIDDTNGTVLLDEGDGKELSFGFGDEVVEFDLHGWFHFFGFFGLGFGRRVTGFPDHVKQKTGDKFDQNHSKKKIKNDSGGDEVVGGHGVGG